MLLLLDNYDSFTWNLYQALAGLGARVVVVRNDARPVAALLAMEPEAVVLSPGPGRPEGSGVCPELIARLAPDVPLLGVCLGHQALVLHHGGEIERDPRPVHGYASRVHHDGRGLFAGMESPFLAGRYHSLRVRSGSVPAELEVCAWTAEGLVMGVRHRRLPRYGVQFHPESILTPGGGRLLAGFVGMAGVRVD